MSTHQADRYSIIGNHLTQHRDLSLTAIGLGAYIQSLPDGAPVDIRTLAKRFPEGRERIAAALRELEAYGYIARVRERTPEGRIVTRTYAYQVPGSAPSRSRTPGTANPPRPPRRKDRPRPRLASRRNPRPKSVITRERRPVQMPPLPRPAAAAPSRDRVPPPRPAVPTPEGHRVPPPRPAVPTPEGHRVAAALLAGLRHADARLLLSERDVGRLAPAVLAWLERGASPESVHRALTTGLPPNLAHPAALLAHRLTVSLPPPLSARPPNP
ncbi:helix-turn-helix domain-containing protein, partial [Streptomyces palmae]